MKIYIYIGFILLLGCKNLSYQSDDNSIDGNWKPFYQEINGSSIPPMEFEHQLLILTDTTYIMKTGYLDEGTIQHANGKMDITGTSGVNKGNHFKATYYRNYDTLILCYDLTGKIYPKQFKTFPNSNLFICKFLKKNNGKIQYRSNHQPID